MLHSGLVSITFRKLKPREIVDLAVRAGLEAIEWGGDVHVPPGRRPLAREVARMTEDAGLKTAAYGSYYRVGAEDAGDFQPVLAAAVDLAAPTLRVWAGRKPSRDATDQYRQRVITESRRIADLAAAAGIGISYEFHANTLTDTNESAAALLREVGHDNIGTYWQPLDDQQFQQRLAGLEAILSRLTNIHCFHWAEAKKRRRPLVEGARHWKEYLARAAATGRDHFVMLEFVADESPENFLRDAAVLKRLLTGTAGQTAR